MAGHEHWRGDVLLRDAELAELVRADRVALGGSPVSTRLTSLEWRVLCRFPLTRRQQRVVSPT